MTNTTTVRGSAKSVKYLTREGQQGYRLAKTIEKADTLNLSVGEKNASLIRDKSLPVVNEGDEVELTGVINSRSGWMEVVVLKNHTSGVEWKFSLVRAMFAI